MRRNIVHTASRELRQVVTAQLNPTRRPNYRPSLEERLRPPEPPYESRLPKSGEQSLLGPPTLSVWYSVGALHILMSRVLEYRHSSIPTVKVVYVEPHGRLLLIGFFIAT